MSRLHRLTCMLLVSLFLGSATRGRPAWGTTDEPALANDQACSYYYFLKGTHAEYVHHYGEALAAYQQALDCQIEVGYIEKKLPVLHFRLGENERAEELLRAGIAKDPADISQYLLLAHLAIQKSERDEAIEIYTSALKQDPENDNVRLRLAILLVQKDRLDEGERIFRDLIAQNGELYLARIYLARLLQMKGADQEASTVYEEALAASWSVDLAFEMIDFYNSLERYDDTLRLYDLILADDATNERAIVGRVQTLLGMGRDEDALIMLRDLRKTNGNVDSLDMAIAKTLIRLEKVEEAKTILAGLRRGGVESEANYLLGLIAFQEKKMESALNSFQQVSSDSPEYTDAVYLQVRILRDFDRYDRAFSLLQKAISEEKGRDPLFFALLSSLYQEKGRLDDAREVLASGTRSFPDSEQLHFELALLLDRSNRTGDALASMQKVLEINPDNPEALNYIGYTWADLDINLQQAKKYIIRAVELKPDNGFIRDSLGWVEYRLGNYDTARAELLQALDLEPEDPNIHEHLGDVYRALRRTDKAIESYQKAYDLFSEADDKARVKRKRDELKNR